MSVGEMVIPARVLKAHIVFLVTVGACQPGSTLAVNLGTVIVVSELNTVRDLARVPEGDLGVRIEVKETLLAMKTSQLVTPRGLE